MIKTKKEMTKSGFTPVHLYTDHKSIGDAISKSESEAIAINSYIKAVAKFLGKELTSDEVKSLVSNRIQFIDEILKPQFPHPAAPQEFNLTALGLSAGYANILQIGRSTPRLTGILKVNDVTVEICPKLKKELEKSHEHHTTNENQNMILERFQAIADQLNELKDVGYLSDMFRNKQLFDDMLEYENNKFGVCHRLLKRIPENGFNTRY